MRRRDLIAATTTAAVAMAANSALAAGPSSDTPAEAPTMDMAGIGLPVIVEGRIRNYVFVTIRLHLAPSADAQAVRGKEPWLRDAIVRAAHRRPFTIPGDWTRLDGVGIGDGVMRAGRVLLGPDALLRAEVTAQAARRLTGVPRL